MLLTHVVDVRILGFCRLLSLICLIFCERVSAQDFIFEQTFQFNISQQPVDTALIEFAEQADLTLVFPDEVVRGKSGNELIGWYTLQEGIDILLAGTELTSTISNKVLLSINAINGKTMEVKNKEESEDSIFAHLFALILASAVATPALAQQDADSQDSIEEIVVSGIRGSLRQSLDRKRDAANLVDAITADDIGAFPDQNLAESLQRIPGVAIDRQYGEGAYVSVRGLGPDYVMVTTNGRVATSNVAINSTGDFLRTGNNGSRIVSFDQFQSGLMQAMEVYKSPQADLVEGGLGGTVNMETRRLIDLGRRYISFEGKFLENELSDSTDPAFFGLYSDTFNEDTMGFMISAQWDDRNNRSDEYDYTRWQPSIRSFDIDKDGTNDIDGWIVDNVRAEYLGDSRERLNVSSALQWRPNDIVDVNFDLLYTNFEIDARTEQLPLRPQNQLVTRIQDAEVINDNGQNVFTYFETTGARSRPFPRVNIANTETLLFASNVAYQVNDRLSLEFDAALAKGKTEGQTWSGFVEVDGPAGFAWDIRGGLYKPLLTIDWDLNDPDLFHWVNINNGFQHMEDEDVQFRVDATYDTFVSWIDRVKVGARYSARERFDANRSIGTNGWNGERLDVAGVLPFPVNNFLTGMNSDFPTSWVTPDIQNAVQIYLYDRIDEIGGLEANLSRDTPARTDIRLTEDIVALYAMAEFGGEIGEYPVSGNFGVRYVETETNTSGLIVEVIGLEQVTLTTSSFIFSDPFDTTIGHKYTEVLPSLNVRLELRDDLIARFAAAKVLSRPSFDQLNPSQSGLASGVFNIDSGNAELGPVTAWQQDLALEWYFAEYSAASFGIFAKQAEGFTELDTEVRSFADFIDPNTLQPAIIRVNRPRNGGGADLLGAEASYQQVFSFLPQPFDGLGLILNYTFIDSDTDFVNDFTGSSYGVEGLSKNTLNATVFYDSGAINARISYNYRDDFLELLADDAGHPLFTRAYEQLDASFRYTFNDSWVVSLDAINLADHNVKRYNRLGVTTGEYFNAEINSGRRFALGLRAQF